jgi:CheY-like chemotaxis protein
MDGDRQRCLDADMDGYISKPVKAVELFEVIDRVMAAARRHAA